MAQRYRSNLETHREPFSAAMVLEGHSRGADLGTDCEHPEVLPLEDHQKRPGVCTEAEELGSNGSWPQSSLSRSLQRAEALLRTTFNPGLKWLLRTRSHDHEEDEEMEEKGSFVAAHNLVSRSSARLLRLQQGMLGVAPHWQLVSGARGSSPQSQQVCVRGLSQPEGSGVVVMLSSPTMRGRYRTVTRLLEQRARLLFVHEYGRRVRSARLYISTLHSLLERPANSEVTNTTLYISTLHSLLERPANSENPGDCLCSSAALVSLAQELKLHLNHWSCLSAKARSDAYLRPVVAQWSPLLAQMRDTLALLALQALVLTERYVFAVLSALAQNPGLESVPREVLEEILAGTELYNQLAEEHRAQSGGGGARWRTAVLRRADFRSASAGAAGAGCHPAAFPVKELLRVMAAHRGNMAARQLHCWASERSCHDDEAHHLDEEAHHLGREARHQDPQLRGGARRTPEWTWEQLERSYTIHRRPSSSSSSSPPSPSILHAPYPSPHLPDIPSTSPHLLHAPPYPSVHLPDRHDVVGPVPSQPSAAAAAKSPRLNSSSSSSGQCQQQPRLAHGGLAVTAPTTAKEDSASVRGCRKGPVPPSQTRVSSSECNPLQTNAQGSKRASLSSACRLSEFCQQDRASVDLLLQALVSSGDLLAPPPPHTPRARSATSPAPPPHTPRGARSETSPIHPPLPPSIITTDTTLDTSRSGGGDPVVMMSPKPGPDNGVPKRTVNRVTPEPHPSLNHSQSLERSQHQRTEREPWTDPHPPSLSLSGVSEGEEPPRGEEEEEEERREDSFSRPRSVQWRDLGRSDACGRLFRQYRAMLWGHCGRALRLHFHHPPAGGAVGSVNLWSDRARVRLLRELCQASKQEVFPKECRAMLDDLFLHLLVDTAHTHWDHGCCRALGSGLKDKCVPRSPQGRSAAVTSSGRDGSAAVTSSGRDGSTVMTATMGHFLCLFPPLLSCLTSSSQSMETGVCPSRSIVHSATVSRALAAVQSSSVWVMSKSYQFLSAWSVNKFLLISHGDLKALTACLEKFLQQTESLAASGDDSFHHHHHHQVLLRQQIEALGRAVSELQAFSALALKIFSSDCKKMSEEIFEQTMPSGRHWRALNYNNSDVGGLSPSEYASAAAESVIGQVVEAVAPFPDDARSLALSVTTTAFMEAWMEHILTHKIRFSIQGALQLKQDFDSIRELLLSDQYRLSSDLHQRLLNLRVFQQVDSVVVCLLQQPQSKPYAPSRAWGALRRCCPGTGSSSSSMEAAVGGSITNLESMEGEGLTQSVPVATPPGAPYLAPSSALGAAQQEWLDLRIHSSAPRWRFPGLQCLSKSEP